MDYTLLDHSKSYRFSFLDGFLSVATGISGAPYAQRHWELSQQCSSNKVWGHRIIAVLEYIPVLGALAALIERMTVAAYAFFKHCNQHPSNETAPLTDRVKLLHPLPDLPQDSPCQPNNLPSAFTPDPIQNSLNSLDDSASDSDDQETENDPSELNSDHPSFCNALSDLREAAVDLEFPILAENQAGISDNNGNEEAMINAPAVLEEKQASPLQIPASFEINASRINELTVKMLGTSKKAWDEHVQKQTEEPYAPFSIAVPSLEQVQKHIPASPLVFTFFKEEDIGPRKAMEDSSFYKEFEGGAMIGVFDGHGGPDVAKFAHEKFENQFPATLQEIHDDPFSAFTHVINVIQNELQQAQFSYEQGSTATVCFIDKITHRIYTATIGDSEANIYRKDEIGLLKSIPLSCVRDWSSKRDAKRAAIYFGKPEIERKWVSSKDPKTLRVPEIWGLNVSRSLGDLNYIGSSAKPAIISKPKITMNLMFPGDILVVGCDGLKDYVKENDIIVLLEEHLKSPSLLPDPAKMLVNYAIGTKKARDNVTVIVAKV